VSKLKLNGSFVALVTPMTMNGEVDYEDLQNLVDYHLNNNTSGLVVLGTTAEAVTLTSAEKEKIVKQVLGQAQDKIPVIVGTGHNCTRQAIFNTQLAADWGADAALIVTPYYNKPSQEGLIAHYQAISHQVDIPIVLYNVPGRTGCDMQVETVIKLSKERNIIGLKEAVGTKERINELTSHCPEEFSLLSGDDVSFLNFLKAGGHGTISVTCNVVPDRIADICKAAVMQDWQKAKDINNSLSELHNALFICSNPVPVKWVLYYLKLIKTPQCRLPLLQLEQKYHNQLIDALAAAGIEQKLFTC